MRSRFGEYWIREGQHRRPERGPAARPRRHRPYPPVRSALASGFTARVTAAARGQTWCGRVLLLVGRGCNVTSSRRGLQSQKQDCVKLCQHSKCKEASDLRKYCARGGTRTAFQPLKTLGTPENIRNPSQSDRCTTQSGAKSVDIVNTALLTDFVKLQPTARAPQLGARQFRVLRRKPSGTDS
jgi:hypothetical protein